MPSTVRSMGASIEGARARTVGDFVGKAPATDGALGAVVCALVACASSAALAVAWPSVFEALGVAPDAALIACVSLAGVAAVATCGILLSRRRVPCKEEIERRVLRVILSQGCMVIERNTPFAQVEMRIRRDVRNRSACVVSENVYLSEFDWRSPSVLKFLGASIAEVGEGDELFLGFGRGSESLADAYRRAER